MANMRPVAPMRSAPSALALSHAAGTSASMSAEPSARAVAATYRLVADSSMEPSNPRTRTADSTGLLGPLSAAWTTAPTARASPPSAMEAHSSGRSGTFGSAAGSSMSGSSMTMPRQSRRSFGPAVSTLSSSDGMTEATEESQKPLTTAEPSSTVSASRSARE